MLLGSFVGSALAFATITAAPAQDEASRVREALTYTPKQKDVDYDRPGENEFNSCKLESAKSLNKAGYIVRGINGEVLRMYLDTNADRQLDRWAYFRDGQEVYADIDANFDGKADQFRWYGAGGSRWGEDRDGDHQIDRWLSISPEEVSAEVVAAIRDKDLARFQRLLLSREELDALKLEGELRTSIEESITRASSEFAQFAKEQSAITPTSKWLQFGGIRPGVLSDSVRGVTSPVTIYDNVAAIVSDQNTTIQLALGTMVRAGDAWRLIELPQPVSDGQPIQVGGIFTRQTAAASPSELAMDGEQQQIVNDYLNVLKEIDSADAAKLPTLHAKLAQAIQKIIDSEQSAEEKGIWIKQFADMCATAYQDEKFPDGLTTLSNYLKGLDAKTVGADVMGYAAYRLLSAKASYELNRASEKDVARLHAEHLTNLEKFVTAYPTSEFASEAIYQLATSAEVENPSRAVQWYQQIIDQFPDSPFIDRSRGAHRRLTSTGKPLPIGGKTLDGKTFQINQLQGKTIVVHYWASWAGDHEITELKRLLQKYGEKGLDVVGVCVDDDTSAMQAFIKKNPMPWTQLCDGQGLQGDLAEQMGISIVPTTLLIGKEGLVVDNQVRMEELDEKLRKMLETEEPAAKQARKDDR